MNDVTFGKGPVNALLNCFRILVLVQKPVSLRNDERSYSCNGFFVNRMDFLTFSVNDDPLALLSTVERRNPREHEHCLAYHCLGQVLGSAQHALEILDLPACAITIAANEDRQF